VLDPLFVRKGVEYEGAFMSGYTERTALSLASTGGDAILVGQTSYLSKDSAPSDANYSNGLNALAGNLYPATTRITALNASVINQGAINPQPGRSPELRLLAGNDVFPGSIVMSRDNPATIPSPFTPLGGFGWPTPDIDPSIRNPDCLPNANDYEPSRIYAL